MKASEQNLDRQQQKLALYANILILLKDSAYEPVTKGRDLKWDTLP